MCLERWHAWTRKAKTSELLMTNIHLLFFDDSAQKLMVIQLKGLQVELLMSGHLDISFNYIRIKFFPVAKSSNYSWFIHKDSECIPTHYIDNWPL